MVLWVVEGEGDRTRWICGGEKGDDGGGRGDALNVLHMVVFIIIIIVVADLGRLRATWYGTIGIFRVGEILCRPRREGGMLDMQWPRGS